MNPSILIKILKQNREDVLFQVLKLLDPTPFDPEWSTREEVDRDNLEILQTFLILYDAVKMWEETPIDRDLGPSSG